MEVTDRMSDKDESRPLSRRELRLREMAAAGVTPDTESDPSTLGPDSEPQPPVSAVAADASAEDIEIPLFDENGRQRSRRELRELREQAVAARAAEAGDSSSAETPQNEEPLADTVAFDVISDQKLAAEEEAAASLTREAESGEAESGEPGEADEDEQPDPLIDLLEEATVADEEDEDTAEGHDLPADQAEPEPEPEDVNNDDVSIEDEVSVSVSADAATDEVDTADVVEHEDVDEADVAPSDDNMVSEPASPVSARPSIGYSFPDIAPLDEGQSVFDDPAIRLMGAPGGQSASVQTGDDFDDLISRAVAQEGAASTTNTSALILPSMPETDSLSGPLGETGELFITGSIDLPKSLGETGGHSSLHDSVDAELGDEFGFGEAPPVNDLMAPVAASRAVSARGSQGPLVAEATKDKSKLPVVLIATGGVLVLGAVGLIVWAATSGIFG